jgi:glycosyltransferase involved in cell wall biosynthesis
MRFLGWCADVAQVYAASDVVMLTSDNEGMPVSLIEAALAGVPAVASRVGSVAEVVRHGTSGLLTGPVADDLAGAVVTLLRDPELRARMGRDARALATERFGEQRLVRDMEDIYTSIAVRHGWWPHGPQPEGR